MEHGLRLKGERVVIVGSDLLLLAVASTVERTGGNIAAIIEQAPMTALARFATGLWRRPEKLRQFSELLLTHYHPASQVIQAQGDTCLQPVTVCHQGQTREIACDRPAIGYGLVPNVESDTIFDYKTENRAIWADTDQRTSVQDICTARECTGFGGSELALTEGEIAGYAAANCPQRAQSAISAHARWQRFAHALHTTFALPESLKAATTADTLLYRCEDTRCGDVQNTESWQTAKLASRYRIGAYQGKVCATSARWLCGWPLSQPREPLSPARIDTLIHLARPEG